MLGHLVSNRPYDMPEAGARTGWFRRLIAYLSSTKVSRAEKTYSVAERTARSSLSRFSAAKFQFRILASTASRYFGRAFW